MYRRGKASGWALAILSAVPVIAAACSARVPAPGPGQAVRVLIDQAPATLNPRLALDASGQRLGALLFRALTRIDADLEPVPDLAERWEVLPGGKAWRFRIREGLKDQAGQPIDAPRIARCLEEYRAGKPSSPIASGFPSWRSTSAAGRDVTLALESPDPYLARNLSLLRYFTASPATPGGDRPCAEPAPGAAVVGSGIYRLEPWDVSPQGALELLPQEPGRAPLRFEIVRDENSRALKLIRGEADAVQNGFSNTKTAWLAREYGDRFRLLERDGVNVSYLAFNLRDPDLAKRDVRRAIAEAISRESVVRNKLKGFGTVAGSFLSPFLPEALQAAYAFDPAHAEKLLEDAGYPRDGSGIRLRLRYKTTYVREGLETALIFQDMLRKIGVELSLEVVEPAVLLASVRKGAFQLHSSRWVGVADGSILYKTLHTGQPNNRAGYKDEVMDRQLELAMAEPRFARRVEILKEVQAKMAEDLPYLPLWYWNNVLVLREDLARRSTGLKISMSGALEPLSRIGYSGGP